MAAAIVPIMNYVGLAVGAYSVYEGAVNNNLGEALLGAVSIYMGGAAMGMWKSADPMVNGMATDQAGATGGTATDAATTQQIASNADQAALSEAGMSGGQGAGNLAGGVDAAQAAGAAATTLGSGPIPTYDLAASQAAAQDAALGGTAQDAAAAAGSLGATSSLGPMTTGNANAIGATTLPAVPNYNLGSPLPSTAGTPITASTNAPLSPAPTTPPKPGILNSVMKNPWSQYALIQTGAGALQSAFTPNAEDVAKYNQQLQQQNLQWLQQFYAPNYQFGANQIQLPTATGKPATNSAGNLIFPAASPAAATPATSATGRGIIAGAAAKSALPQTIPVR